MARGDRERDEKIVVLDRGNVEFAVPVAWSVKPDRGGFMKMEDATEECLLEVSYLSLPQGVELPSLSERLGHVLDTPEMRSAPITSVDRGDLRLAWIDYPYESADPHRGGAQRPARARWLLADNGLFQVLATFYYWVDDVGWAVPAWERVVETLQLGNGVPIKHPRDHWAMRAPD